jgi:hypothetical protein
MGRTACTEPQYLHKGAVLYLIALNLTLIGQCYVIVSHVNPLNAELNSICHLLILLGDLTLMGKFIVSISNKMQRYTVYLYLKTALHVSGGTSTHHQERINCIYSIWYLSQRYCYLPLSWKSWNRFECAVGGVRVIYTSKGMSKMFGVRVIHYMRVIY